jgi:site-specific recombinase XerD
MRQDRQVERPQWMPSLSTERHPRFNLTPLPLQFPSLTHFGDRVAGVVSRSATVEGLSPRTVAWMNTSFRLFRRFLADDPNRERTFLSGDASRQMAIVGDWVMSLRARGVSHTSTATYWHGLKTTLRRLEAEDGCFNPTTLIQPPRAAAPLPRCLTRNDAVKLLRTLRNLQWRSDLERSRNEAVVGLMLMAGLRRGEVLRLEFADVHLAERTISIRRGKGRHGGKDRTSYMTPQLRDLLSAYIDERRRARRTHPEFITSVRRDGGIGEVSIRRLFKLLSSATGVHVTPHMLRHTYATLLRQSGVADRVAQELLGHSSLAMLQRYSHVFEGEYASEAAKLHFQLH